MTVRGCFADWQLGCSCVHGRVAVLGWDQSCHVWRVLRGMCLQGPAAVSLGRRLLSGWEGSCATGLGQERWQLGQCWVGKCWKESEGGEPEMLWEELGGRGNPAAFPLPWQWFPSATAVTSPQPCSSSSSRSGSATQRCHKAQVSSGNVPTALGPKALRRLYQDKSNHIPQRTFSRPEIPLQGLPHLWVHKAHWSYPKARGRNVCTILCLFFSSTFSREKSLRRT